jgi:hypothetical protein
MQFQGMTVRGGVVFVMNQLDCSDRDYARRNGGFAALHDICDANMLLPTFPGVEVTEETFVNFCNSIMDGVTAEFARQRVKLHLKQKTEELKQDDVYFLRRYADSLYSIHTTNQIEALRQRILTKARGADERLNQT